MVFSSLHFLYLFLPLCVLLYFLMPSLKAKNAVLLVFSLVFYAWGEPVYVLLMLGVAAANWAFGLLMERISKKAVLIAALVFDLGCLAIFKYAGFLTENLNALTGMQLPVPQIALPIGISFYTFQILSYVVDVYRGNVRVQASYPRFLLYVSLFPQLIAGPIVRYADVEKELADRRSEPQEIFYGMTRFCMGLAKKVLLADYAGKAAAQLLDGNLAAQSTLGVWFGVLLYTFEIYFDFSGYSDMAIGLGRIFGFKYPENFRLPYMSRSITEFWRRWHISLSSFFRDYLYIPLGGNRRHVILNLAIVWALTGLWHGASWNFVLWGMYFFVLLVIERYTKKLREKIPGMIRWLVTFVLIVVGWNIFYFTDAARLSESFRVMFGAAGTGFADEQVRISLVNNLPLLILCAIGSTPLPQIVGSTLGMLCASKNGEGKQSRAYVIVMFVFDLLLLALCTIALVSTTFNAFLYFRF